MEKWIKYCIVIFLIIFLIILTLGIYKYAESRVVREEHVEVSITTLYDIFINSETIKTNREREEKLVEYTDKIIISEGTIKEKEIHVSGVYIVYICAPDDCELNAAKLYFQKSDNFRVSNLKINERIKFKGRIEDYSPLIGVLFKDVKLM